MKKILAITTISCVLLVSCDSTEPKAVDIEAKKAAEYTRNVIDGVANWKSCCKVNTALAKELDDYEQRKIIIEYIPELLNYRIESDWRTVDRLLTKKLNEIITSNLSEKERLATNSIQYTILKFIDRYLLVENPSKEIASTMERYLTILVRHQGVDLSIMADGLLHSKEFMSVSGYSSIRQYVYTTAEERQEFALNNIENYVARINQATSEKEKNVWYFNAKGLENQSKEAEYVMKILETGL